MLQAYAEVNYLRFCQCPHFSASEVTTLRCYTNLFIIIILSRFLSITTVWCSKAQSSAILLFGSFCDTGCPASEWKPGPQVTKRFVLGDPVSAGVTVVN